MKYLGMIQARCGSSRLPNKVLKDLYGKPVLQRVIERVQRSRLLDEAMVVTSIEKSNLPLVKLCAELGIRVGVGSETDVLDRFYQSAKLLKPEYVIRITADCPCFDSGLLDEAIETMDEAADYRGMLSETFADGLDLEIIRFEALAKSWREAQRAFEREHVTQYIIRRPELFRLQDFVSPVGNFGHMRWTLDEPEDYELIKRIYERFALELRDEAFSYRDVLSYLDEHPEITQINRSYQRNEGLQKSIREDSIVNFTEGNV